MTEKVSVIRRAKWGFYRTRGRILRWVAGRFVRWLPPTYTADRYCTVMMNPVESPPHWGVPVALNKGDSIQVIMRLHLTTEDGRKSEESVNLVPVKGKAIRVP